MAHTEVADRTFVVVGLARSGCAAGALLRRHGARVIGVDDSSETKVIERWRAEGLAADAEDCFDEIRPGGEWHAAATTAAAVVLSPGVPLSHPDLRELPSEVEVIGELEIAARFCAAPIIAITGTNGKSTTTELTAHLARAAGPRAEALGNVGRPLALVADELEPSDLAVVEVSSFQLETICRFAPQVGMVLNLEPDHLDRYATLEEYYGVKQRLVGAVRPGGRFVTWTGCAEARRWPCGHEVVLFGEKADGADTFVEDGRLWTGTRALAEVADIAQRSALNLRNACAAVAALTPFGLDREALAEGLGSFRGLEHRQQVVARRGGVVFIDDSKATNVAAAQAALDGYPKRVILIAGGSGKGEDYRPLRRVMAAVERVILIGAEGPAIGAALDGAVKMEAADTLEAAVARGADLADPDGVVMLSPACASFDMFRNYHERGAAFRRAALATGALEEADS